MINVLNDYQRYLEETKTISEATINFYIKDVKLLLKYVDEEKLDTVTEEELNDFVEKLLEIRKESTVSRIVSSSRTFFNFLIETGHRDTNPMVNIKFSVNRRTSVKANPVELEKLFETPAVKTFIGLRDKIILELICATTIKLTELMELKVRDVDVVNGQLRRKSSRKPITFSQSLAQLFNDYLSYIFMYNHATLETPLFTNVTGSRLSRQGYWKIIKRTAEKAGLGKNISPIVLRNTVMESKAE